MSNQFLQTTFFLFCDTIRIQLARISTDQYDQYNLVLISVNFNKLLRIDQEKKLFRLYLFHFENVWQTRYYWDYMFDMYRSGITYNGSRGTVCFHSLAFVIIFASFFYNSNFCSLFHFTDNVFYYSFFLIPLYFFTNSIWVIRLVHF